MLPHHTTTSRLAPLDALKASISAMICSASPILVLACFTCGPFSRLTYSGSNAAGHGASASSSSRTKASCAGSNTPALRALW